MVLYCKECGLERNPGKCRCDECHKIYKRKYAKDRYTLQGRGKYSHICIICKNEFTSCRKKSDICKECWENPKQGIYKDYIYITSEGTKTIREHRKLAELILKRTLNSNEHVHHLDEDMTNNVIENLIILDRRSHSRLHYFLRRQKIILKDIPKDQTWGNIIKDMSINWLETSNIKFIKLWELNYDIEFITNLIKDIRVKIEINKNSRKIGITKKCEQCNVEFKASRSKNKYCSASCYIKAQKDRSNIPSEEKLKELILNIPFTDIAKQYGVSDSAIRKWCKSFGLPYKKKDIIEYFNKNMEV